MKKYLLLSFIVILLIVLMGCDQLSNLTGEITGEGNIAGTISYEGVLRPGPEGAEVWVITDNPEEISDPENIEPVAQTVVTNSTGNYLIENIPDGTYYVIAWKDTNGSGDLDFDSMNEPADAVGYHSTVDGEDIVAVPVVITGNDSHTGVDITLEIVATMYTLTGQVETLGLSEEPAGISGSEVTLYGEAGIELGSMITSVDGFFGFDLPQGEYYLQAEADGYLNGLNFNFQINDNDIRTVKMITPGEADFFGHMDPAYGMVGGMVDDGTGAPVQGATVSLTPQVSEDDIGYLVDDGVNPPYFDYNLTATTDQGVYAIRNVPPGEYTLTVSHSSITFPEITINVEANSLTSDGVQPISG